MDRSKNNHKRSHNNDEGSSNNKRLKSSPPDRQKSKANVKTTAQSRLSKIRSQQASDRSKASSTTNSPSIDPDIKLQKNVVKFPLNDCQNKTFDFGKKTQQSKSNEHTASSSGVNVLKIDETKQKGHKIKVGLSPSERLKAHKREGKKLSATLGAISEYKDKKVQIREGEKSIRVKGLDCKDKAGGNESSAGFSKRVDEVREKEKLSKSLGSNPLECSSGSNSFKIKSSLKSDHNNSFKIKSSPKGDCNNSFKIKSSPKGDSNNSFKIKSSPKGDCINSFEIKSSPKGDRNNSFKIKSDRNNLSLKPYESSVQNKNNLHKRHEVKTPEISFDLKQPKIQSTPSSADRLKIAKDSSFVESLKSSKHSTPLSSKEDKSLRVFTPPFTKVNEVVCSKTEKNSDGKDVAITKVRSVNDRLKSIKNTVQKDSNEDRRSKIFENINSSKPFEDSCGNDEYGLHQSPLTKFNVHSTPVHSLNSERSLFSRSVDSKLSFGKVEITKSPFENKTTNFNNTEKPFFKNQNIFSLPNSDSQNPINQTSSTASPFVNPISIVVPLQSQQESGVFTSFTNPQACSSFTQQNIDSFGKSASNNNSINRLNNNSENPIFDVSTPKSSLFSFGFVSEKLKSLSSFFKVDNSKNRSRFTPYGDKDEKKVVSKSFLLSNNFPLGPSSSNSLNNIVFSRSPLETNNNVGFARSSNSSVNFFENPGSMDTSANNLFQNEVILDRAELIQTRKEDVLSTQNSVTDYDEEESGMDWSPEIKEDDTENESQMKNMISEQTSYHESEAGKTVDQACGGGNDDGIYVAVDTNVFLHKLEVLGNILKIKYEDGTYPIVYVPWMVIQELDYFKDGYSLNKNSLKSEHLLSKAKKAIVFINQTLVAKKPNFKCEPAKAATENSIDISSPDDSILSSCLNIRKGKNQVMLLSGDINLRNKAIINGLESLIPDNAVSTLMKLKKLKRKEVDSIEKASHKMSWLCSYVIYSEWKQTGDRTEAARFEKMPWNFADCIRYMKENYDRVFKPFLQKQSKKIIDDIYNMVILNEDLMEETKFLELVLSLLIYIKTGMKKYEKNIALVIKDVKELNP